VVEILPLRQTDISEVLRQRFGSKAEKLEGQLGKAGISTEIMTSPLLLNLTSQLIDQLDVVPTSKTLLMERAIDLSLSGWDRARNIQLSYTVDQKRSLLKQVALIMRDQNGFTVTLSEGVEVARDVLGEEAGSANAEALVFEALRSGLLVRGRTINCPLRIAASSIILLMRELRGALLDEYRYPRSSKRARLPILISESVRRMQFSFMVGITEPHRVDFSFDQFAGRLEIKVDGIPIVDEVRTLSVNLTKRYDFVVGLAEKHHVTIEKERKLLLAGLQPQQYRIFIDGQLVQTYEG